MAGVNTWMRTQRKKLLAVLCAVIMFTWVIGGALDQLFSQRPIPGGTVFGEEVSGREFEQMLRALALLVQTEQRPDEERWRGLAWETILLSREARRAGLSVSEDEVSAILQGIFSDRVGVFDPQAYQATLSRFGLSPSEFENALKDYLLGRKAQTNVRLGVPLTTEEAWRWWSHQNARARVRYAYIDAERLVPHVEEPTEAEILEQYGAGKDIFPEEAPNRAGYRQRQKVKIEYILIDPDDYLDKVEVTEEDIEEYYEANKEDYLLPDDEDEDPGEADADEEDGDVAEEGEEPQEADEEEAAPAYRPLEVVRVEIAETLRQEKARQKAESVRAEVAREIYRQRDVPFGSTLEPVADLEQIARDFDLPYERTRWFTANELRDILPGANKVREQAFQNTRAVVNEPRTDVESDKGLVVYQVVDTELARPAPLDEVRDKVIEHVRLNKAILAASAIATEALEKDSFEEMVAAVEEAVAQLTGKDVSAEEAPEDDALDDPGEDTPIVMVGESNYFGRPLEYQGQYFVMDYVDIGKPQGNKGPIAAAAFRLRHGEADVAVMREGAAAGAYIIKLVDMHRPGKEAYLEVAQYERARILAEKREAAMETWMTDLIRRARPSQRVRQALAALDRWPIAE